MPSTAATPLQRLSALGQSVWVDFLSRDSIHSGHLQSLIDSDAVVGATSNPSIFQQAMTAGHAYDDQLREIPADEPDPKVVFWALAEQDIREACDLFRPVWDAGGAATGTSPWRSTRVSPMTRSRRSAKRCASTRRSSVPT